MDEAHNNGGKATTTADASWQRARTPAQIARREAAVLAAATRLFASRPYDQITLRDIAAEAGFTRSNVYRYFRTREDIFLRLYRDELAAWATAVRGRFTAVLDTPSFVDAWVELALAHPTLLRLTPLLAVSLERNGSTALYRDFKRFGVRLFGELAEALGPQARAMGLGDVWFFLQYFQALVAGAWPMAQYTAEQEAVLAEPDLAGLRVDFPLFLRTALLRHLGVS